MSNEYEMEKWRQLKPFMWSLPGTEDPSKPAEMHQAVLGYLLRNLSRGRVPRLETLMDYLEGRDALPSCGYIGCHMSDPDHVH
jgi:hypothetical protein